jgi:DNA-binding LacI/PurR family transcriptional regulator
MDGYQTALEEYGLELNPELVRYCPPTVSGGKETAIQLIHEHPEITALFCFNDLVAIGVLQSTEQTGRIIPDNLAIIGYDDIPMASWVTPALTTCKVNFEGMGKSAMQLLIDHIEDCADECSNMVLEPQLVIRNSAP